ncbi:hypothetical protein BJQ96_01795 [Flavobacterium sp. PL0002]|nr:hypothetical protein [Flavobacterium sp. PL002]
MSFSIFSSFLPEGLLFHFDIVDLRVGEFSNKERLFLYLFG